MSHDAKYCKVTGEFDNKFKTQEVERENRIENAAAIFYALSELSVCKNSHSRTEDCSSHTEDCSPKKLTE